MANEKMVIRFYPVGNGDSTLVKNDDGVGNRIQEL